jgi:hypothetical protein
MIRKAYSAVFGLTVAVSLLLFSSCNDCTTSVARFGEDDSDWTVYEARDTLLMVDDTDIVRVFVSTRVNSDPVPGDGFDVTDPCIEQYYTRRSSVMQHAASPRLFPALTVVALKTPETVRINLVVAQRADLPIPDIDTPQHAEYTLEEVTYQNVYDITNEESGPDGVQRILFNRTYGFLRVEFADGRTLTRIPPQR